MDGKTEQARESWELRDTHGAGPDSAGDGGRGTPEGERPEGQSGARDGTSSVRAFARHIDCTAREPHHADSLRARGSAASRAAGFSDGSGRAT
jgi:hypothetical protein